jgi:hypothetical protein
MSITFFLKNHNTSVKVSNPDFNTSEPEDPIYNTRYLTEDIYPNVNFSNVNAIYLLRQLSLITEDMDVYVGEIENISELSQKLKVFRENHKHDSVMLSRAYRLEILAESAKALDDTIVWA